ncbi:MAG TPA: N-acetylneuraminate synthase family protein [Polyangiaceae bacterium]|jgi:N-acetylneuraminate synthase|nr:N-acetylneuraminate synthase family protein [Polyangiaceae bacterium]
MSTTSAVSPSDRRSEIKIGDRMVGDGHPVYVIAEIGINHNGSLEIAKKMIDGAVLAGCDAVKFQKRTPEVCVPKDQWAIERDTPWGRMTYIDYRHKVEFNADQYAEIDRHCKDRKIHWFASCWDEPAVDFMERFEPPCYKIASASVTDGLLLERLRATGRPQILSTGMSTLEEIAGAVDLLGRDRLALMHAVSMYPCDVKDLNLRMIATLKGLYPELPIGYSGHETGLVPTFAAVSLGATMVERHITLDRAMWGTDQAASVEIGGLMRLVSGIRDIATALGDGVKKVHEKELAQAKKLRRTTKPSGAARA